MDAKLKQRIVGIAVLMALGVIFLPIVLSDNGVFQQELSTTNHGLKTSSHRLLSLESPDLDEIHKAIPSASPEQIIKKSDQFALRKSKIVAIHAYPMNTIVKPDPEKAIKGAAAWVIQLTNASSPANAKTIVQKLRHQGFSAFARKTSIYIGPVISKDKAIAILADLDKKAKLKGNVMPYAP